MNFEQVIGLEVHCELKTHSKMFSAAPVTFGEDVNTMVNEVDLGMTGTMPVLNKRGVEFAIRVCHALHMEIDELLCFDRKNYYYSDLPKGFQITQDKRPIGRNGYLDIEVDGEVTRVEIERLHMEEDTAKQFHFDDYSLIDYNRAGIPLIEIVTRPNIGNGAQAAAYLEKLRQVFLYTDVSDAKMEEGSMRCDVNISIRPFGSEEFGIRTEIKNLNSISNVQKAIEFEAMRQEKVLIQGGEVKQETRRFDEDSKETVVMRAKGDAVDYKYYTEPNILPIRLDHQWVMQIKDELPMMADERAKLYIEKHGLPQTDANILVASKDISDFYEETIQTCQEYKLVCNWLLGEVQAYLNKENLTIQQTKLTPAYLGKMISFIQDGTISSKQAKKVFECLMSEGKDPEVIIEEKGMKQISDPTTLTNIINEVLDANEQSIQDYAAGKDRAVGFLVGQIMKKTGGQANPKVTNQILIQLLKARVQ
ncbi:MAG: Asp-tRNA(Asn)/Glu-tRNA(Gln) amidotransferase subunit GatB [Longibaculum muris]|uniref:Aspartyl/glutamyl-tRNA(Asn/Gln) amidotransferase subunit B n=1 Tax=Longibaculum muris TaxID=1796628 RepID=A0A4R3YJV2_9FIRM|nr:Asp-tRNA(Asn)/Glu-tRNA(Gln) amidotransferase subunit GatB [Longibaculum muris]KXU52018.1 aspartyl/glutamyl-tRNA(Asn/Gln) amidotransferase, B subunit [Candidatus Stoquefichus sp. KLE1796]MBS5369693.1 Asp-tRNA(Asn)/Glu-tRNA(Gln) amidotransferase subunit GatB [Coprobacillus cateniformis]MCR1889163.1 Asp-tRNA(Asn)/Glu-tRNA(Gln) amidotransferase subunit GatB [Longibaculum muris]MED9810787.1 Asp-tRNA(Asn)/Glu-tRNA(Gln) amidotransferase subunit GatB [Longibaculum muris]TCV92526.1 aspartyl/glutamyl